MWTERYLQVLAETGDEEEAAATVLLEYRTPRRAIGTLRSTNLEFERAIRVALGENPDLDADRAPREAVLE